MGTQAPAPEPDPEPRFGTSIREPSRGLKLTLNHASYPLSCGFSQKALSSQPGLSGSQTLSLIALTVYLCLPGLNSQRDCILFSMESLQGKKKSVAGSDDRPEETPLLKFLDRLWNFPAQEM